MWWPWSKLQLKIAVFWVVAPCSLVETSHRRENLKSYLIKFQFFQKYEYFTKSSGKGPVIFKRINPLF
jgi:hypothetical protein